MKIPIISEYFRIFRKSVKSIQNSQSTLIHLIQFRALAGDDRFRIRNHMVQTMARVSLVEDTPSLCGGDTKPFQSKLLLTALTKTYQLFICGKKSKIL